MFTDSLAKPVPRERHPSPINRVASPWWTGHIQNRCRFVQARHFCTLSRFEDLSCLRRGLHLSAPVARIGTAMGLSVCLRLLRIFFPRLQLSHSSAPDEPLKK
jgi:hypothetical protein